MKVSIPSKDIWEIFVERIWQQAIKDPQELLSVAVRELGKQQDILKDIFNVVLEGMPPGTGLNSKLPDLGYENLESIDYARCIGDSGRAVYLNLSAPDLQYKLNRYVEKPAQKLVMTVLGKSGEPVSSNAYGPGLKGVFWLKDGVRYFTPLTINDYAFDKLSIETLKPIKIRVDTSTSSYIVKKVSSSSLVTSLKEDNFQSTLETKGGIDLNPANLNIEVIGEVKGANLQPFNPLSLDIQNFQGFTFQIIGIQPVSDWEGAFALGLSEKAEGALS